MAASLTRLLDRPDATLVSGDAVDVVARLKQESEVPLRSHGCLSMNRALMAAGLVDRVQVTLFPVIPGQTGLDPIFKDAADFDPELIENRTLDGDIQELVYRPPCIDLSRGLPGWGGGISKEVDGDRQGGAPPAGQVAGVSARILVMDESPCALIL